ncbi:acyltransferase family protein [Allohahella sp. A8]|uniref:acyltransferase family protein n=1 Tax=Allohahella sp. A8 TaxID=3141461 RepID=UPI003A7FD749
MLDQKDIKEVFRTNNFDLLRLFAASQVAILHAILVLKVRVSELAHEFLSILFMFPGVPIFFFVSGYLISKSYESNSKINEYWSNRILRLYPALILAVTISFVLIFASGYAGETDATFLDWVALYLAKVSFVQFYNPDFMRAYGDGVLNGSLWTITVELQFYLLVPIIYSLFNIKSDSRNIRLICLIILFFALNRLFSMVPWQMQGEFLYKIVRVSFLPWFYMFLVGVFFQRNFLFFHSILAGKFWLIFPVYLAVGYFAVQENVDFGNNVNPFFFFMMVPLIFSFAYSMPTLAQRITRGNDVSYGIYIYHMPIINCLIYFGLTGTVFYGFVALALTLIISLLSWFLLERNCLKLKNHPFNPINRKLKEAHAR